MGKAPSDCQQWQICQLKPLVKDSSVHQLQQCKVGEIRIRSSLTNSKYPWKGEEKRPLLCSVFGFTYGRLLKVQFLCTSLIHQFPSAFQDSQGSQHLLIHPGEAAACESRATCIFIFLFPWRLSERKNPSTWFSYKPPTIIVAAGIQPSSQRACKRWNP